MESIRLFLKPLLLVLICSSSSSAKDCTHDKRLTPKLVKPLSEYNSYLLVENETYVDIKVDKDFTLICEGTESITWHTQYDLYSEESQEFIHFKETIREGKHISELIVNEIRIDDIGVYSCHYKLGFDIENPKINDENSVYLFVTDPNELLSKEDINNFPIVAVNNSEVKQLCRPTSSFTNVSIYEPIERSLLNNYKEISVGPQTGVYFDPKIGFTIKHIQKSAVKCVAQLEDKTTTIIRKFHFVAGLESELEIIDTNPSFLFVGNNLTLNCLVKTTHSAQILLNWTFHDYCNKEKNDKLIIGELEQPKFNPTELNSKHTIYINVSVINLQLSDSGIYTCTSQDVAHTTKTASKVIQVYESPKLELKSNVENEILWDLNREFIFNITINSVPNIASVLKLEWYKDRTPVIFEERVKTWRIGSESVFLKINNTLCDDSALYTIEANLLDGMKVTKLSFHLSVKGCKNSKLKENEPGQQNGEQRNLMSTTFLFVVISLSLLAQKIYSCFF